MKLAIPDMISNSYFPAIAALMLTGCAHPEFNQTPPASESDSLSEVIQLTSGFDKAGEAYFSGDMQWVIFQAVPREEQQYQMYVAPVIHNVEDRSPPPATPPAPAAPAVNGAPHAAASPSPGSPMMLAAGVRAPSKKTSLNSEVPVIWTMGRMSIPARRGSIRWSMG